MIVGFSTGLDSFVNMGEIGPMYPFVGGEWLFVAIGVVLWLLWHAGQIIQENQEEEASKEACRELGLERVMYYGGSAVVPTEAEWEEAGRHGYPGASAPTARTGGMRTAPRTPGEPPPAPPHGPDRPVDPGTP